MRCIELVTRRGGDKSLFRGQGLIRGYSLHSRRRSAVLSTIVEVQGII